MDSYSLSLDLRLSVCLFELENRKMALYYLSPPPPPQPDFSSYQCSAYANLSVRKMACRGAPSGPRTTAYIYSARNFKKA